ncbi:MAG: glycosyltransferase family 4 protein [Polyangiaceae bacterium]|nr:glycosyltransferase family 4 protein [Polyangiaceae bacterium]
MSADVLFDLTALDTPIRFGGTGRYIQELGAALDALDDREREGLVIRGLQRIDGDEEGLVWPAEPREPRIASETRYVMQRRLRLPRTLRRLRPALFHAPFRVGTPRGSFVPRVVTCLDLVPFVLPEEYFGNRWAYRRLHMAAEAARYHGAARVLCISQHTADDLMRVLRVPARKIDVALLGVDLARYRVFSGAEAEAAAAVRARHGLRDQGYVFYMGRADPRKNVDVLVAAFARARVPDLELVIIGHVRPSDEQAYERALAAAGRPAGVRFLGFVPEEDLPAILGGALGFVFCSTYEGFGNVPIEAAACGCPVITTGVTSMRETIADVAFTVPPRDVEATAAAIRRLATEPSLRRDLALAGLRRAASFSWRNTALGTVACYARALRNLGAHRPGAA